MALFKRILILLVIILFTSCTYRKNGAGIWELDRGPDSSFNNNYSIYPERRHRIYGTRYPYYSINGTDYRWDNEILWKERRLDRYDRLWKEAEKKGINPHWWIDKKFSESEASSRN
jgi:hypothetical protein